MSSAVWAKQVGCERDPFVTQDSHRSEMGEANGEKMRRKGPAHRQVLKLLQ